MIYDEMLDLCDAEHIIFSYEALEDPLNGIYITCDGMNTIMLSDRIRDKHPLRNIVLAEELGHHFTLSGCNIPLEHWNRLNRINYTKNETSTLRWAAKYLLPKDRLLDTVKNGVTEIPAIAEYYEVPFEFVLYRLSLPDIQIPRYQDVI